MTKKFFTLIILIVFISACGNTGKKEASSKPEGNSDVIKVEFASLTEKPEDYVGKTISVTGKVVHVCMMSGKKMFITGENPDIRLYVAAGEEMPKFPTELLGSEVEVQGTLTRQTAMAAEGGAGMHAGKGEGKGVASDSCETEKALAGQPVLSDLMMIYNKHSVVK
jgi:hypothetical protein